MKLSYRIYGFDLSQKRWLARIVQILRKYCKINLFIVLCVAFSATYSFAQLPAPSSITYPSTDSDGNFTVSWSSVSGATNYQLWRSQDSDFSPATVAYNGSNTSYSETGLADGTYYYRVLAYNDSEASDWRSGGAIIVGCSEEPSTPGSITYPSTDSDGSFTVSWSSVSGATNYQLWRSQDSDFSPATVAYNGSNTSYSETGLADGTYYYRVIASNDCGASGWRSGGAIIVGDIPSTPPNAPTVTASTGASSGQINLSWTAPSGVTGYVIVYDEDGSSPWSPIQNGTPGTGSDVGNTTSTTISGLTPGQRYYFSVAAYNSAGLGNYSSVVSAIVGCSEEPSTPGSITYPSTDSDGSFTVSWSSVSGATNYQLWRSQDSDFSPATVAYNGSNTSYSETGLADGTYYYRVIASNDCGASGWRSGGAIIVGDIPSTPPNPPAVTAQTGSNSGQVDLNWTSSIGATGYVIVYDEDKANPPWSPSKDGNPGSGTDVGNVSSITLTDLTPGQAYNFSVAAYNANGIGNYSTSASATASYSVSIQSNPSWAEVYLDADFIGNSPATITGLGDNYHVYVKMPGYEDYELLIDKDDAGKSILCDLQVSYFPEWEEKTYSWVASYPLDINTFTESEVSSETDEKLNWLILQAEKKATGAAIKSIITSFASKTAAKIGGIVFSIIQEIPTVGFPSDRAVIFLADGQAVNTDMVANKDYVLLYIYTPGSWINPPREITVNQAIGLNELFGYTWSQISTIQLLTNEEANSIENFPVLLVTKQPISFSEAGIYEIDGIQFEIFGDDVNKNGVPDNQEVGDNTQTDICHLKNVITGDTVSVWTSSGSITQARTQRDSFTFDTTDLPTNYTFKYGLFNFVIDDISAGQEIEVTFHLPEVFTANDKWFKYYELSGWADYTDKIVSGIGTADITLVFKDGEYGDSDGIPNGVITDPGGAAFSITDEDGGNSDTDDGGGSSGGGGGGGCFIATAAFGSYLEPNVQILRRFRDEYLTSNGVGRLFLNTYYKFSPPAANFIGEHDSLRPIVRLGLAPVIGTCWIALNYGPLSALLILFSFSAFLCFAVLCLRHKLKKV